MRKLFTSEIPDDYSKENFNILQSEFNEHPILRGNFVFREITFNAATADQAIPHGLNFVPKDIWVTSVSTGTVTVNYSKTDKTSVYFSPSVACTIRVLIGNMEA